MTPAQCRAARGLLQWSQGELAKRSGLSIATVVDHELERRTVADDSIKKMRLALESGGVEFTGGKRPGVRMAR
jgi:transcriptional regulator with XRE-family HTH domain